MTALNREMSDKLLAVSQIIFKKIKIFRKEDGFNAQKTAFKAAYDGLKVRMTAFRSSLFDDTIKMLPEQIDSIKTKLDELEDKLSLDNFLETMQDWDDFLVAQSSADNAETPNA